MLTVVSVILITTTLEVQFVAFVLVLAKTAIQILRIALLATQTGIYLTTSVTATLGLLRIFFWVVNLAITLAEHVKTHQQYVFHAHL